MRAMPLSLPGKVVLGVSGVSPASLWTKEGGRFEGEPTSVLDTRASPSPPTSTSTLSGGGGSAVVAAVSESFQWQDVAGGEWAVAELGMEVMGGEKCGLGMDDCWEDMLAGAPVSPHAAAAAVAGGGGQEQSFFRWFTGGIDDDPSSEPAFVVDPGSGFDPPASRNPVMGAADDYPTFNISTAAMVSPTSAGSDPTAQLGMSSPIFANSPINLSLLPNLFYHEPVEEKPTLINHQTNQSFFLPMPFNQQEQQQQQQLLVIPPNPKRHQPAPPFMMHQQNRAAAGLGGKQTKAGEDEAAAAALQQVVKAGELVEAGNSVHARGILARLNHHLPSPAGKPPLLRAGFYFSDALRRLLDPSSAAAGVGAGAGVVLKIAAYKAFSEVSPVLQFANFTANQALLEAVHGHPRLHILDFDVGLGGQWSSFLKDLAGAALPAGPPSLKITAFLPAGAGAGDLLELGLTRENLAHFAADLNIPFDLRVAAVDSLDPSIAGGADEAVAVNLPASLWPSSSLLRVLKQLKPTVVVSLDRGAEQGDLLHSLHSHAALLDSLDATSPSPDALQKIERFLVGPRIEKLVAGRHCAGAGEKALPLSAAFAAAGFSPAAISSFAETQAECLVKRVQVKGFHVKKRPPAALCLCWQRSELAAVSAWRC